MKTESFSGFNFSNLPDSATYTGNTYNGTQNPVGCGYTPPEIWTAYHLTGLYKEGFDGTGQTIVIIGDCASPIVRDDANIFSARFDLPQLTSSNFHIHYLGTTPTCEQIMPEYTTPEVEWAHAIAPGANIAVVATPGSNTPMDLEYAQLYAIANHLGNVISGSYWFEELYTAPTDLDQWNLINEVGVALGISSHFPTGDIGDFTFDSTFASPTVSAPADSPYATAIGGVSLALNSNDTIDWQAGWGNNFSYLAYFSFYPLQQEYVPDPPTGFFNGGSGGGPSAFFSKPSFQHKLAGTQRLLPDISWLADPYTPGVVVMAQEYGLVWQPFSGTELSCAMFSGLWAIANQEAGKPLGQAARHLYSMPAGSITDVVPVGSSHNVKGTITDPSGTTSYTAAELAAPLDGTTKFYSALWDDIFFYQTTYLITFGTDSGLKTAPGWDDVTGLGTPNGKAFADFFNPAR